MLAALSASPNLRLRRLLTREDDDFTIALLDAWATTLDVLTFYQERIANESYLRTATERLSLLQLARAIGYELRPGVAASTALAFTIEDAPGALPEAVIDVGVKVQSVPGHAEQAQVFETIEQIVARGAWNAIRPRQTGPQALSVSTATLWVRADANLKQGDTLLIVALASGGVNQALRRVAGVERDDANNRARLLLEPASMSANSSTASETGVWALRVKAAPFGHNAPLQTTRDDTGNITNTNEWPLDESSDTLTLDATYEQVTAGSWAVIDRPATPWYLTDQFAVSSQSRSRAALGSGFAANLGSTSVLTGSIGIAIGMYGGRERLFAHVEQARATSRAAYGIAARGTQLTLDTDWTLNDDDLGFARDTAIFTQSEPIELVEAPLAEAMPRNMIALNGDYGELTKGRLIAVGGRLAGSAKDSPLTSEIAEIAEATTGPNGITTLKLTRDLANVYRRSETTINANVARATHGETARETLGSGDASRPYQRFTLKSAPLTYTSAANASGSASTLELRVNDLLWREVPTLYGRGLNERVYVTRTSDEAKTTVQFGDGATGARLPSGSENVRAAYRKGSGVAGNLKAGQLSMLMSRPLGLKGAVNPEPATGGVDAEQRDEARQNAPLTVMTLDRIVSLRDYEDFARAFRGVAKALATWTWDGRQRGMFVTVAGANGAAIAEGSATYQNLVAAMRDAGDPYVPLRVQTYRPASFTLSARLTAHPDYGAENVARAVRAMLAASFAFATRAFGQPVALSEVMAAIQQVAGVIAVDIDTLQRNDGIGGAGLVGLLPAARPQAGAASVQAAELLLIEQDGVNITVV